MRYKPVPEPRALAEVRTVADALPLVPGGVDDCCLRLQKRADVPNRERARSWLPFLVALGLAGERDGQYYRRQEDPDDETLADHFREHVLGVEEVLAALSSAPDPLSPPEAFAATRGVVPQWERNRRPEWERDWRARTERVLEWAVILGLVEKTDGGYAVTR